MELVSAQLLPTTFCRTRSGDSAFILFSDWVRSQTRVTDYSPQGVLHSERLETALRRGDSGELSSCRARESRKIEKPRSRPGLFYFWMKGLLLTVDAEVIVENRQRAISIDRKMQGLVHQEVIPRTLALRLIS